MGDVVNLNKVRKKKAKQAKQRRAEQNRLEHGLTKAERKARAQKRARAANHLDAHKLGDGVRKYETPSREL